MPPRADDASAARVSHVDITVLVPLRNEERHLERAIAGMRSQRFAGAVEYLLIDGGSTDATPSIVADLTRDEPRFRVVVRPGWNIPQRLNLGLRMARGDLVARMDAHTVFPPNYLADGVLRLERGDVASVSGPQIAVGEGFWSRNIALALRSAIGRGGAGFRRQSSGEIVVDSGYCGIWPRALLLAHGGWDERASRGEDMELAFRIRAAGGKIVCVPTLAARYSPRESLSRLALQYWRYAERRAWAASLHPQILRRSHLLSPSLALTATSAVLAPPPLGRAARRALTLYGLTVLSESIRLSREDSPAAAVALPAIFPTMHLAWGFGFLFGCVRHGVPYRLLLGATRLAQQTPS